MLRGSVTAPLPYIDYENIKPTRLKICIAN